MMQISLYEFYLVVSLLVLAILLALSNRYFLTKIKPTHFVKKYMFCQLTLPLWLVFLIFEIVTPNDLGVRFLSVLKMVMLCYFGYGTINFLTDCIDNKINNNNKKNRLVYFFIFLIILSSFIYSKCTGKDYYMITAIIFMLQIISFSLLILVKCIMGKCLKKINNLPYFFMVYLFILLIYFTAFLDIINIHSIGLINLLSVYNIILLLITSKNNIFNDLSVIFEGILQNVHYGIIVVDNNLKILTYNNNFFEQFINKGDGDNFVDLINKFKSIACNKLSIDNILTSVNEVTQNHIIGEIIINSNSSRVYLYYNINPIYDAQYKKIATMISFMDISQLKDLQQGIENKNKQLVDANIKLKEHMENLSALISENERNKLMAEINDTIGHFMTEILGLLEVCSLLLQQNDNKRVEKAIIDTINRARIALNEIRQLVSQYKKGVYMND